MNHSDGKEGESRDEVAHLLRLAGPRPEPDPELQSMVFASVEREWRLMLRQRRTRRGWLAAAVIVCSVTAGLLAVRTTRISSPVWVGTVVSSRGQLQVTPTQGQGLNSPGDALVAGTRIETGDDAGMLFTIGSASLRLAADSVITLLDARAVKLTKGKLFVDSGASVAAAPTLRVSTDFGAVRHRGTQYQVQVTPGRLLFAAVREGQVDVDAEGATISLTRGDAVRVTASHEIVREVLPPYSEMWQWVSDYAPAVSIDGRNLSVFIEWYARESGLVPRFIAPATRDDAEHTILKGSVVGLSPLQALQAVLSTTHYVADFTTPGEVRIGDRDSAATMMTNGSEAPTPRLHR